MTRCNDSGRRRRSAWHFAAAVLLLASIGWSRHASAADPRSGGSGASGRIGGGLVRSLVVDPFNPATIYAASECFGVVKSVDGGVSWRAVGAGLPDTHVVGLFIDPETPTTLYVASGGEQISGGVFKSTDAGDSWSTAELTNYFSPFVLAIDPRSPNRLYATTGSFYDEPPLFKSTDGGSSWSAAGTGLPPGFGGSSLAIAPTTTTTVYVSGDWPSSEGGAPRSGVLKSTNGGALWCCSEASGNLRVYEFAVDPTRPTTVYAAARMRTPASIGWSGVNGVFKSTNSGRDWSNVLEIASNSYEVRTHAVVIDPSTPRTLYAGFWRGNGTGGVFKSTDAGETWSAPGTGLPAGIAVLDLAIDPMDPATLYAATVNDDSPGGVVESTDGAATWHATGLVGGEATCGDGILACGERCDDGNLADGDGCDHNCTPTACGNGVTAVGEECDDGNTNAGDGCDATCGREVCGDAILQPNIGERCDDGNLIDGDGCDHNCTPTACGNGVVSTGEECDDGNRRSFDGCTNDCTVCGDGVVTATDECDDGNTSNGDDCDAQCRWPHVVGTGTRESCTEAALDAALDGSVSFDCGTAPLTIPVTSEKVLTSATAINGGDLITLSGGGAVRIFTVDASAALEVRNLTIAGGHTEFSGSAISNSGTLSVTNCSFSGSGVAIDNWGTLTMTDTTFSGNSGIVNGNGGLGYVTYSTFSMNSGIENSGTLMVTNSTFSMSSGIGNHNLYSQLTVTNSTFVSSGIGNDFSCFSGSCIYANCGAVVVANSTFAAGAGISASCRSGAETFVTNSIIASCDGVMTDGGHNLQFPGTSCGATIPSLDPRLDPAGLQDNGGPTQTIALLPGSPAINAGDPDVCANPPVNGLDQRGYARPGPASEDCSIGAFESGYPTCVGDCDGNGAVAIYELVTMVNIGLDRERVSVCEAGDRDRDGRIMIHEVVSAVSRGLEGCG